jgi:DUF1680 family protein
VLQSRFDPQLLGGITVVEGPASVLDYADWKDLLYRARPARRTPARIRAVPYYAWDHRAPGQMRVWLHAE